MDKKTLAAMIDHSGLKAFATEEKIRTLCAEAAENHFASVCVNPANVELSARLLAGTGVKVCVVVGFPLGANTSQTKAFETRDAIARGADEIDMVINIGALKSGDVDLVERDIRAVVEAANGTLVKVITENCYLTDEEKVAACQAAERAGADYVKTSTGFGSGGATAADVALMRRTVSPNIKIKAAGSIRTYADVMAVVEAGADRVGTSASLAILQEME